MLEGPQPPFYLNWGGVGAWFLAEALGRGSWRFKMKHCLINCFCFSYIIIQGGDNLRGHSKIRIIAEKFVGLSGLTEGSSGKIASQPLSTHCSVSSLSLVHWTTLPQHESNLCVASQEWHTLVHWGWHGGHGIWGSDCWPEHWSLTWYSWPVSNVYLPWWAQ